MIQPTPGLETEPKPHPMRGERGLLVVGLLFPVVMTYVFFVAAADLDAKVQQWTMGTGKLIQFSLPLVWWFGLRREKLNLPRPTTSGLGWGVAFGLAVAAAMWFGYFRLIEPYQWLPQLPAEVRQKVTELGCDTPIKFAALGTFYTIVHSFLEEYYWRWFIFGGLRGQVRLTTAVVLSSLGFMAHHVVVLGKFLGWLSPGTWLLSLAVAVGGAFWAWLYHRTGTLYASWISHMIVDAAIFLLGYQLIF